MTEILQALARLYDEGQRIDAKVRAIDGFCYMFKSGAKLSWFGGNSYGVYCYSDDASDGVSACNELRLGQSLNQAALIIAERQAGQHRPAKICLALSPGHFV